MPEHDNKAAELLAGDDDPAVTPGGDVERKRDVEEGTVVKDQKWADFSSDKVTSTPEHEENAAELLDTDDDLVMPGEMHTISEEGTRVKPQKRQ